jgi:hypothetical protein
MEPPTASDLNKHLLKKVCDEILTRIVRSGGTRSIQIEYNEAGNNYIHHLYEEDWSTIGSLTTHQTDHRIGIVLKKDPPKLTYWTQYCCGPGY